MMFWLHLCDEPQAASFVIVRGCSTIASPESSINAQARAFGLDTQQSSGMQLATRSTALPALRYVCVCTCFDCASSCHPFSYIPRLAEFCCFTC